MTSTEHDSATGAASKPSPLYKQGRTDVPRLRPSNVTRTTNPNADLYILCQPETIEALRLAQEIYYKEMYKAGYSPITIGTYQSQVGRFILFLEQGRVLPDTEQ